MNARHSTISDKTRSQVHYERNARQARSDYLAKAVVSCGRSIRESILAAAYRFRVQA